MPIPRILHQTWKDEHLPAPLQALSASWKERHPGWEYRLWTDEENRELIREHYPGFLKRYDAYPYPIQRVDAARYFILYTYGGLYVDLDFACLRSLEALLSGQGCVFGLEPQIHCEFHHRSSIICNALMAAAPGHPFFRAILEDMAGSQPAPEQRNNLVLETTGPFMLTRVYEGCRPADVCLLPSQYLYPLSIVELEQAAWRGWSEADRQKLAEAYAIHYFAGTWWRGAQF